jgi:SAM-dependent methyltransferase
MAMDFYTPCYLHDKIGIRKLNFGCGMDIKRGFDNVDINSGQGICQSFDFNVYPWPIKDNLYDYVYCRHVFEHLKDIGKVMNELHRICSPNAVIEIYSPHFNDEGAFSTIGHISYFTEYSFTGLPEYKWEVIKLESLPSPHFGRFIPKFMRRKLSVMIRGVWKEIHVILKVKK